MATRTLDAIWSDLEKAQADYETYCQTHAEVETAYRKLGDRVRECRTELGEIQETLSPCIACGGSPGQLVGPQVAGAHPSSALGQYKILCAARTPDQTITLDDGSTQVVAGEKVCRFIARGRTWEEALKRWQGVREVA